jgi:pyruvate,water dikinase
MKTYAESLVEKFSRANQTEKKQKTEFNEDIFVKWLSELGKDDIPVAGGKGANLAEMFNSGMPVPPAFVITAQAYDYFLKENNLYDKIKNVIKQIDVNNTQELEEKAKEIRGMVAEAEMPSELQDAIVEAYNTLNIDSEVMKTAAKDVLGIMKVAAEPCFVAVRSSATTEDLGSSSFAGQQETFLNVKGNGELISSVKKCFASLFTARAIFYRAKRGFEHEKYLIAVIIQRMINSDKSGVIFTINPLNDKEEIIVEAVFGLGEGIVSGTIMPDHYVVNKKSIAVIEKSIGIKELMFTRDSAGKTFTQPLLPLQRREQVLTDSEIKQLSNYSLEIESHYHHPQDIEFAIEAGRIYIVQTRPITTIGKKEEKREINAASMLDGLPASPGIASGVVKIINNINELNKIQRGDILVTKMTNPDMVVSMQKASAIVTDEGGATAHAAIVSREIGIPCVVGTKKATSLLKEGMIVTVNGFDGRIYEGKINSENVSVQILPVVKTRTKIKVLVELPDFAERAAKTEADGVGLVRLEGIIASAKKHPLQYLKENKVEEYEELIFNGLSRIAKFFRGKSIWIRTSDIRSDEFQDLEGSPTIEKNPMLGVHGIRASLKHPELFKAELNAIKRIAEQGAVIGIMFPQVISIGEVIKAKAIVNELDMNVEFGVMIETPAAVEIIDELCKEINFISFGTNDLTQYTLAIDRGNEALQDMYDEMHPAVLSEISKVINSCKKNGVKSSICGQAGSKPEMARFLVKEGIDSISVNADAANEISKIVAEIEQEINNEGGIKQETATETPNEEFNVEEVSLDSLESQQEEN